MYWHHNKINNIAVYYPPVPPTRAYQIDALRLLPSKFINFYWQHLCHNVSSEIMTRTEMNFNQAQCASFYALKPTAHAELPGWSPLQYIFSLTNNMKDVFLKNKHISTLRLLWYLSNGNLISLERLHDMLANIYWGQEYINAATSSRINVTIIRCKDMPIIRNFLTKIFDSTFLFPIDTEECRNEEDTRSGRLIYSEIPIAVLYDKLDSCDTIIAEHQGVLVNISRREGNDDLEILKKVSTKKEIRCKADRIFKDTKHEPYMHYIYITDQPVPPLSYDVRMIELMGDVAGTEYLPTAQDAATIVLLSLFNFFYPTKAPQEYIDIAPPHTYNDNQDVIKEFIRVFFKDTTSTIAQTSIDSVKKRHEGNALNDKLRLALARELRITDLDYTINNDLKELYGIWKESDPDHIPDMDIKRITTAIKEIYDPLFYVKNNKAQSTLHPEDSAANVKAFYGLSVDMEKVSMFKKPQESKHQESDMQKAFHSYYKDMIHNYCILQPEICRTFSPFHPIASTAEKSSS